jgi:hypothetical protein
MRRRPNPWFFLPVLLGIAIGGVLGWLIVGVGCDDCVASQATFAGIGGLVIGSGVGVVMVLVIRSLDEHKARSEQGLPDVGVGCEVPEEPDTDE